MLKSLVVITLASVGFTSAQFAPQNSPEKRVTVQRASSKGGHKAESEKNSANTPSSVTVNNVETPTSSDQQESRTAQQNLDIQRQLKTCTVLLVVVGFLQVATMVWQGFLLWGTMRRIKEQAKHMEGQNRITMSKERARLVVKILPDTMPITHMLWQVRFQVGNVGPTHAFNVWLYAAFNFALSEETKQMPEPTAMDAFNAPRIRADRRKSFNTGSIFWQEGGKSGMGSWSESRMTSVSEGKLFLHLCGWVRYQDTFGETHITPFRFLWDADLEDSGTTFHRPKWEVVSHTGDPEQT